MSANKNFRLDYRSAVRQLERMLPRINSQRSAAETVEEVAAIEGNFVSWFMRKLDGQENILDLREGDLPMSEDWQLDFDNWTTKYRFVAGDTDELIERYLQYENNRQAELLSLEAIIARVAQKAAAADLWSAAKPRDVWVSSFRTRDGLSSKYLNAPEVSYDFDQGLATLPITKRHSVGLSGVRILAGSNGQPGNSDTTVQANNNNPNNMINGREQDWFEYERLDQGPVVLKFAVDLSNTEIINHLEMEFVEDVSLSSLVVDDIVVVTPYGSKQIEELVGPKKDKFWKFNSYSDSRVFGLTFLPAEALSVIITLRATLADQVDTVEGIRRPRYGVGIRRFNIQRLSFDGEGAVASTAQNPISSYVILPVLDAWPRGGTLYDTQYEYSLDGGATWKLGDLNYETRDQQSTVLLKGNESQYFWRTKLSRKDSSFSNTTKFFGEGSAVPDLGMSLTSVSRFASPATVVLRKKPTDGTTFVMQPQLLQLTDENLNRYVLGVTTGDAAQQKHRLPVNVFDMYPFLEHQDEFGVIMRATVGGQLYAIDTISDAPGTDSLTLATDGEHIWSKFDAQGLEIVVSLPGEQMVFEQRPDGYYHECRALFDPSKDRIRIFHDPQRTKAKSKLIPSGRKFVKLGEKSIVDGSIEIIDTATGLAAAGMTKKSTYGDLLAGGDYYVDTVSGVLYLHEALAGGTKFVIKFRADTLEELADEDYAVVMTNGRPSGIRIDHDAFKTRIITENLDPSENERPVVMSGTTFERRDIRTGKTTMIDDVGYPGYRLSFDHVLEGSFVGKTQSFLANGNLPEEIAFIDGVAEFSGLTPSLNEQTSYIQADATGVIEFSLAARGLWEPNYGITFGDDVAFNQKVGSVGSVVSKGQYYVSNNGLVTVHVGANEQLPGGIDIFYFYTNPDFDPSNKFSVDYPKGVLWTDSSVGLDTSAVVTYKTARYKIWYDVAAEVSDFEYDPETKVVSINTEAMFEQNSLIRVVWPLAGKEPTLEKLASFFSPLIYSQGHVLQ